MKVIFDKITIMIQMCSVNNIVAVDVQCTCSVEVEYFHSVHVYARNTRVASVCTAYQTVNLENFGRLFYF